MTTREDDLVMAVAEVEEKRVMDAVRRRLAAGVPATEILADCNRGMIELGNRFAREECYLPELMFGGVVMKSVMAELTPHLRSEDSGDSAGTVVMGAVQHDVHDIGKDILVMMLRGIGFEVIDLGVDVPPDRFAEAVAEHKPIAAGLSILLTTCFDSVSATVKAIEQAGLRDGLAVMVGGAAASELLKENTGCDFYGKTAVDGVKYVGSLAGVE